MAILDTVKGTVTTAVDTISSVTQTLVEKNRTNAKLNRLRLVMKNESELMNRAYISIGKQYYEMQKKGITEPTAEQEKLFAVIETSKAKIAKARDCYRQIVDSQDDIFYGTNSVAPVYNPTEVVDITVACSNENEYDSSPFNKFDAEIEKTMDDIEDEVNEFVENLDIDATPSVADELTSADEIADDDESDTELF